MYSASHLTIDDLCAAPALDLQGSIRWSTAILLHAYLTKVGGCMSMVQRALYMCSFYCCHKSFGWLLRVLKRVRERCQSLSQYELKLEYRRV